MTVEERIRMIRLLSKVKEYETHCEQIGIRDVSRIKQDSERK